MKIQKRYAIAIILIVVGVVMLLSSFAVIRTYMRPGVKIIRKIVGISCAEDTGHWFAFYDDGYVSSGHSDDLGCERDPYPYDLPAGKSPSNIVGIAMRNYIHPDSTDLDGDRIPLTVALYNDNTFSIGISDDLAYYMHTCYRYSLPRKSSSGDERYSPQDIVGVAAPKGTGCFAIIVWFADGRFAYAPITRASWDTNWNLDFYNAYLNPFGWGTRPPIIPDGHTSEEFEFRNIVGMDRSDRNRTYTFFKNGYVCIGSDNNLDSIEDLYRYSYPKISSNDRMTK